MQLVTPQSRLSYTCECKMAPCTIVQPAAPANQSAASNKKQSTLVYLPLLLSLRPSFSATPLPPSSTYRHYPAFLRERRRNRRWWGCIIASITEIIYTSIMSISPHSLALSRHYLSRTAMTTQLGQTRQTKLHRQRGAEQRMRSLRLKNHNVLSKSSEFTVCAHVGKEKKNRFVVSCARF